MSEQQIEARIAEEIERLKVFLDTADMQEQNHKQVLLKLQSEKADVDQLRELSKDQTELQSQIDSIQEIVHKDQKVNPQIDKNKEGLSALKVRVTSLDQKLARRDKAEKDFQTKLKDFEKELIAVRQKHDQLTLDITKLVGERLDATINQFDSSVESLSQELSSVKKSAEIHAKINSLATKLNAVEMKNQDIEEKLKNLQKMVQEKLKADTSLSIKIEDLQKKITGLKIAKQDQEIAIAKKQRQIDDVHNIALSAKSSIKLLIVLIFVVLGIVAYAIIGISNELEALKLTIHR